MKVVIVGAGKVGYFLADVLVRNGKKVTVIDKSEKACIKIANELNVETICADASTVQGLAEACKEADVFAGLTGHDEDNLISCQIAKQHYKIATTIARINNPKNNEIVSYFGVDKHFCGTDVIVELIENEIEFEGMSINTRIKNSDHVIVEFVLSPSSPACEKKLSEYKTVGDAKIVVIASNDGNTIIPTGDTVMHAGDDILLVCREKHIHAIWEEMVKVD